MVRVRAWSLRFISNCRKENNYRETGELSVEEVSDAEKDIFRESQSTEMKEEIKQLRKRKLNKISNKFLMMN